MSKHPIKESKINICKGLFVCMCLFSLRICCKGYAHYSKSSALHYMKVTGDKERGLRCLIHSDCIWKHVLKILANGIYHIRKNTYMRKAQIRTEAATLATSVLTNVAVFSQCFCGLPEMSLNGQFPFLESLFLLESALGRAPVQRDNHP